MASFQRLEGTGFREGEATPLAQGQALTVARVDRRAAKVLVETTRRKADVKIVAVDNPVAVGIGRFVALGFAMNTVDGEEQAVR